MTRMKDWAFADALGVLKEPKVNTELHEFSQTRLFGRVYDDPRQSLYEDTSFKDGHRVVTSPIHEINWKERYAKTRSGTVYVLDGNPNKDYLEWLKKFGVWEKYHEQILEPAN